MIFGEFFWEKFRAISVGKVYFEIFLHDRRKSGQNCQNKNQYLKSTRLFSSKYDGQKTSKSSVSWPKMISFNAQIFQERN